MKKLLAVLFSAILMLSVFAPVCYAVDGDRIEKINVYFETNPDNNGEVTIGDIVIRVNATLTSGEVLNEDFFKVDTIKWYKQISLAPEAETTVEESETTQTSAVTSSESEINPSDFFKYDEATKTAYIECDKKEPLVDGTYYYFSLENLYEGNGTEYNNDTNDLSKISIAYTPSNMFDGVENGDVLFDAQHLTIAVPLIYKNGSFSAVLKPEEPETTTEAPTVLTTKPEEKEEDNEPEKCKLCGICPFQPSGVCLFIWVGVIVAGLVVILLLALSLRKKDEE